MYHMHTCLLPIANVVVMQVPSFCFCALPFTTAVVLWTIQALLFTKWSLAWEIVGFEFQCIQGLLSSSPFTSSGHFYDPPHPFWVCYQQGGSDMATWQLVLARLSGVTALCCTRLLGAGARCGDVQAAFLAHLACLRAATLCVHLETHGCRFHRKASFSSV